jgi:hypothetical protein
LSPVLKLNSFYFGRSFYHNLVEKQLIACFSWFLIPLRKVPPTRLIRVKAYPGEKADPFEICPEPARPGAREWVQVSSGQL